MTADPPAEILLRHTRDKVVVIDGEGTFTYCNDATREILGFDPEELIGANAFDFIHPDDVAEVRSTFAETVVGPSPDAAGGEGANAEGAADVEQPGDAEGADEYAEATIEYRHRRADGSWVWLESRFSNLTHEAVDGYVVSSRDVTDRVLAERERDETAARLHEISENATDVLWSFTADWDELLFLNPAYEDVYGHSVEAAYADPTAFLDYVHPDDRQSVRAAMGRISRGERADLEYRVNPSRNFGRWVWVQGSPIVEDGEVVRIVGFSRDVTERKRREKQLAVIDNVLRHNLRNDLNKILGYADEMGPDAPGADVIRQVGLNLLDKAEKQREVNRLLRSPPATRRVDLVEAVERAVDVQRRRTPDAEIETALPDELIVDALPEIETAVVELLDNAVLYASSETGTPRVSVTAEREDGDAVLVIRDWNQPVPEYDRQVLTGRGDDDDVAHSTGLGLWLVYWVVDLSDGSAAFERPGGDGNVARIRLPMRRE